MVFGAPDGGSGGSNGEGTGNTGRFHVPRQVYRPLETAIMVGTGGLWRLDFSERTVAAINGAVTLASQRNGHVLGAKEVANTTHTPLRRIRGVLEDLKKAGLVEADKRGPGSFRWRGDPRRVSLYEIAAAVGERFDVSCSAKRDHACGSSCSRCPLNAASGRMKSDVIGMFRSKKLRDLLQARA